MPDPALFLIITSAPFSIVLEYVPLPNSVGKYYILNFESEQLATQAEEYLRKNFMPNKSDYYIEHIQTNCDMIQLST